MLAAMQVGYMVQKEIAAPARSSAAEGGYLVESNCIIAELRRSKRDIFAARMLHTLRPAGESLRIALKKVLLLNNDGPIDNLTFLV
ncbi:MAG: hypothetical protein ACRD4P_04575 [Bryobacteraceae bacterium]